MISINIYTRYHADGSRTETPRCVVTTGPELALQSLAYYRETCRYTDAWATKTVLCDGCRGAGTVAKKRPIYARKTCSTCKGVEASEMYCDESELNG